MGTPLTNIDWTATGLVPTSGLQFWHQFNKDDSADNLIKDYSGNDRDLSCASSGAPVLTPNILNGQPGWYFDGTSNFLNHTGGLTLKHLFIVASFDEATFTGFRGLFTDSGPFSVLVSDSSGTKFVDYSSDFTSVYKKNDVVFISSNQQAPVVGAFALIELQIPAGIPLDAIQIGQQTTYAARKHKGFFIEQLGYSRVLSPLEIRRVQMHFNLRHRFFRQGIPLYFPDKTIVPQIAEQYRVHNRFIDTPQDWSKITDVFEFQDGTRTFNEVADEMPREWEYRYENVPKVQKVIFDEFNSAARRATPFYFKDPEGVVWSNVRIKTYGRSHDAHKRWTHEVPFVLVGDSSIGTFEGDLEATSGGDSEITMGGDDVVFGGDGLEF